METFLDEGEINPLLSAVFIVCHMNGYQYALLLLFVLKFSCQLVIQEKKTRFLLVFINYSIPPKRLFYLYLFLNCKVNVSSVGYQQ